MLSEPVRAANPLRPTPTNRWRWLAIGWLTGLAFLLGCFPLQTFDTWWHLRAGELIPERGVPYDDWFSFTSAARPWVDVHWVFQLLIAYAYRLDGVRGLILCKATVCALAVAVAAATYKRDRPISILLLCWIPTLLLISGRFFVRPEMLTLFLLAITLAILQAANTNIKYLWWLLPVQLFWANIQGLYVLGLVLQVLFAGQQMLSFLLRQHRGLGRVQTSILVLIGSIGTSFISPYGLANFLLIAELWMKMDAQQGALYKDSVAELKPVWKFWLEGGWRTVFGQLHFGVLVMGLASLYFIRKELMRGQRWFEMLTILAFSYLGLQALRNGSQFGLVVGTLAAWNLSQHPASAFQYRQLNRISVVLAAGITFGVGSGWWHYATEGKRQFALTEQPHYYATAAIRAATQPGLPKRAILYHMGHAAKYIHMAGPEYKVFFDARLEVHSRELFQLYLDFQKSCSPTPLPGFSTEAFLQQFNLSVLVADGEHNSQIQAYFLTQPQWRCLHFDEVAATFVRLEVAPDRSVFNFRDFLFPNPTDPELLELAAYMNSWENRIFPPLGETKLSLRVERLLNLGTLLAVMPQHDPQLIRVVLWAAYQASELLQRRHHYVASQRNRQGRALYQLALLANPGGVPEIGAAWQYDRHLLLALAGAELQRITHEFPKEFSPQFLLVQHWEMLGCFQLAAQQVAHLQTQLIRNAAQHKLSATYPARRSELQQKAANQKNATVAKLQMLDSWIKTVELSENDFTAANALTLTLPESIQRDSPAELQTVAEGMLLAGFPKSAERIYRWLLLQEKMPTNLDLLRLRVSQCRHAQGQFNDHTLYEIRVQESLQPELYFSEAIRALQNNDMMGLAQAIQSLQNLTGDNPTVAWLAGLLPEHTELWIPRPQQ